MVRWVGVVAMLAAVATIGPASARERGPVCREPSVVDEMTRQIRLSNYYSFVNPKFVTEQATRTDNVVRCQVCVQSAPYEMTQFGDQPIRQCLAHGFEVRIVPAGFVVRDLQ
nr:hypothetical protein [uncultured Rhodopila sp.]